MQLISYKLKLVISIYGVAIAAALVVICAPTDPPESSELEGPQAHTAEAAVPPAAPVELAETNQDELKQRAAHQQQYQQHHQSSKAIRELDYEYYYKFRNVVSEGVKRALDECRQKFKWDRWNCPLKSFQSIMNQDEEASPMPSNKELGLTRALISSGIVLSIVRSCSVGTNSLCSCSNPITMPEKSADLFLASGVVTNAIPAAAVAAVGALNGLAQLELAAANQVVRSAPASYEPNEASFARDDHQLQAANYHQASHLAEGEQQAPAASLPSAHNRAMSASSHVAPVYSPAFTSSPSTDSGNHNINTNNNNNKFEWTGCDEVVKLGFRVAKAYLKPVDKTLSGEASQRINAHNFEAGRQAVKRTMKRRCKCQGPSGACQMKTCWTILPDMSEVGDYLKKQYRVAAKVGASTAKETDAATLSKELAIIGTDKLVFADASPDYCYENKQLGISGTIGRYCSRTRHRNGTEVTRSERDSCDRLCTKCGYRIKREEISTKVQCDCRFNFCCSIECKQCPVVKETFKCVRHLSVSE